MLINVDITRSTGAKRVERLEGELVKAGWSCFITGGKLAKVVERQTCNRAKEHLVLFDIVLNLNTPEFQVEETKRRKTWKIIIFPCVLSLSLTTVSIACPG